MNHLHIHRVKEAHLILYSIFFTRQVITFVHLKGIFRLLIPSGDMSFPTHYWQSQYIQKNKKPWAHKVKFKSSLISQENNSLRAEWEQN